MKKIIAYSSVGHMGLVTIGIFSSTAYGIVGSVALMLSHGITSSALFILIGLLYERYHTRVIKYYSGLSHTMPIFSVFFVIFSMANLGMPITSNFVGEFLVLLGCFSANSWIAFFAGTGLVLSASYALWLCNRILFGNAKCFSVLYFQDLNRREVAMLLPFGFLTFLFGIYPECFFVLLNAFSFEM